MSTPIITFMRCFLAIHQKAVDRGSNAADVLPPRLWTPEAGQKLADESLRSVTWKCPPGKASLPRDQRKLSAVADWPRRVAKIASGDGWCGSTSVSPPGWSVAVAFSAQASRPHAAR